MKLKALTILLMLLGIMNLAAQSDPQMSQYYRLPAAFNPAAAGMGGDYINLCADGRLQWVGIDGAPTTFTGTANTPFKLLGKRFVAGAVLRQESIGLYNSMNVAGQFGYSYQRWGGSLTGAVQAGLYSQRFTGTDVVLPDGDDYHQGNDPAIPMTDLHGSALDLGAGIFWNHPKWWAGLSATHLTAPVIKLGGENSGNAGSASESLYEFSAPRTLYFAAGCNIPLKNTLFELMPSVLAQTDFTNLSTQVTAVARYRKFLSFGLGYRLDDAVVLTFGADFKDFFAAYSFDYATSALRSASGGSHEVAVGYRMKLDLGAKNQHRHKSIRFM